ncbi:DUF899-domain-containing protein [Thozetella sp. PMI_491]|nr:DUF899-domain-containing protein [Thozetella sp. PMI_491]
MSGTVVSYDEWQAARKALAQKEDLLRLETKKINEQIRGMPMVKIDKNYTFEGPGGEKLGLKDLFDGKSQLIVYHFMFEPSWENGCPGCSFLLDQVPEVRHLGVKDVTLCAVSPAPQEKIQPYKKKAGWAIPWYSTSGSDFGKDIGQSGIEPCLTIFALRDGDVFMTYSLHQNLEKVLLTFTYLDMVPLGRQIGDDWANDFKRGYEYDEELAHA